MRSLSQPALVAKERTRDDEARHKSLAGRLKKTGLCDYSPLNLRRLGDGLRPM